jgi:NAD+ kinase
VTLEILEADKRPVSASADGHEVRDVVKVEVLQDFEMRYRLLFDLQHNLEERILSEQFVV